MFYHILCVKLSALFCVSLKKEFVVTKMAVFKKRVFWRALQMLQVCYCSFHAKCMYTFNNGGSSNSSSRSSSSTASSNSSIIEVVVVVVVVLVVLQVLVVVVLPL